MNTSALKWLKENWFRLGILLLILIALIVVAYYFLYLIPNQRQGEQWQQTSAQISKDAQVGTAERDYKSCLFSAQLTYDGNWSANCIDGSNTSGCKIPSAIAVALRAQLASDQDLCEKHYNDTVDSIK